MTLLPWMAPTAHAQEPGAGADSIAAVIVRAANASGSGQTESAQASAPRQLVLTEKRPSVPEPDRPDVASSATALDEYVVISDAEACARKGQFRKPARKPANFDRSTTYRVKPGDQLEISIWKEPDMRREMLVLPDGTISYPLAGHVQVVGMTPKEIEDVLSRRLSRYFKNPFLNVIVKRTTGNQIYVLGEVRNPGAFTINQPIDVMQALSLAGGLNEFADKGEIIVLRRLDNGKQDVISFKYSSVQRGRNLGTNVKLVSGDTVVVPERGLF